MIYLKVCMTTSVPGHKGTQGNTLCGLVLLTASGANGLKFLGNVGYFVHVYLKGGLTA